jgi:NADPH-dependent 2,4-dienoyl-CoA reductase/sulfur reductase-like enzyme/nitrite reductase/ring-hydroxylating ferredoxin subunit
MSDDTDIGPDLRFGVAISRIPEGTMHAGSLNGTPILLVNHGGQFCAVSGKCTHQGAPLKDGLLVDGQIHCPWHHARFSVSTGEALAAPALQPLATLKVTQRDGKLFVIDSENATSGALPRVVIVGSGAAGHACADMLARSGFGGPVTVISDDTDPPYDRTACSKDYLSGMLPKKETSLAPSGFYHKGGPALHLRQRVTALHLSAKEVELDNGKRVAFDALVLATGAQPKRPDLPGFDRPNVYVLRTLRDADAIIKAARKGKKAVIVGASFIGLEAAAALIQRKVNVEVVGSDAIPLEKVVGPKVGKMVRAIHESKGVRFHLKRQAASFDGSILTLDDGSQIEADFVILGVGVTPRIDLAENAGLKIAPRKKGGGVVVDAHLETSAPGVYAVGDIAYYPDRYVGRSIRVEHWVHAQRQGQHVARVLMGQSSGFADLPFFWSAHFDTTLQYMGHAGTIKKASVSGSIADRDFTITYSGEEGDKAILACNRDLPGLQAETDWEYSAAS